jgi:glutamine synthetase
MALKNAWPRRRLPKKISIVLMACAPGWKPRRVILGQALEELQADDVIQAAMGQHVYERYVEAKSQEWNEYRLYVSQWELDRYLTRY